MTEIDDTQLTDLYSRGYSIAFVRDGQPTDFYIFDPSGIVYEENLEGGDKFVSVDMSGVSDEDVRGFHLLLTEGMEYVHLSGSAERYTLEGISKEVLEA